MNLIAFAKSLRYLVMPRPYRLERPAVLQFPVIDICNSQCQMCRIWENKKSDDIDVDALRKGLRNRLYSEVTAVGLNGGEPTLRKDLGQLASVLFEELPRLRSISLITNAYKEQEVIERITEVGEVVRRYGGVFDVMVSLDGVGGVHDLVRGKPGNFVRAQKVIEYLQRSPLVGKVRIGCTIIKANVYGLADLLEYCRSKGLYIKYRLGIPHQRLYTKNLLAPYALTDEEIYHVVEFMEGLITHYETSEQQRFFYRSLIDQLVHGAPRKAGCDWQHRGATITSKGELLYCAVQSKVLGNIVSDDSEEIYFTNAGHVKEIISTHCDQCHHDYMGIPPKREYARQLAMQVGIKLGVEPLLRKAYRMLSANDALRRARFARRQASYGAYENQLHAIAARGHSRRVLICGWYGTETLGDKAILGGVLHALRRSLGEFEATLVSLYPYVSEMTRRQMSELAGCNIVDSVEGVRLAGGMDLVVFGGGPLMAIDELAEMQAIFQAASRQGVPTLIAGCGVGPLGDAWHNEAIGQILSHASVRIYRDERSRQVAGSMLGIDTSADKVAEDPAFTWLKLQRATLRANAPQAGRRTLLLGLRDFPSGTYARHLSESERLAAKSNFEEEVVQALKALVQTHPDLLIRPLPMCTNHLGGDDRWFYRKLFRGETQLLERMDLSLLGAELSPLEYCAAFVEADVALVMRFHALVFALGLEVPAVAIDYTLGQGKVHALAERFNVPHQNLASLDKSMLVAELSRLIALPKPQAAGFVPQFAGCVETLLPSLLNRR